MSLHSRAATDALEIDYTRIHAALRFSGFLNRYAHANANMHRTDLKIQDGRITVHPTKLKELIEEARAKITPAGIEALKEAVIDEELEAHIDHLVAQEIEEQLRTEIRAMLTRGLGK
jgi:hypothetical protein